jgi:hypothetical protein
MIVSSLPYGVFLSLSLSLTPIRVLPIEGEGETLEVSDDAL